MRLTSLPSERGRDLLSQAVLYGREFELTKPLTRQTSLAETLVALA
jgi:hypothetical protein